MIAITFVDSSGSMQAFANSSLVRAITVNTNGIQKNTEKAKCKVVSWQSGAGKTFFNEKNHSNSFNFTH